MSDPAYLQALNPEQKEAVVHQGGPLLILAGAGSGKTRVITTKIAYLVDRMGTSPRSILAVTFTNKAAQEMKERVLAIVPRAEEVMVRTFHSFGAWFLRVNAARAGLSPHFSIYDQDDSVSLLKSCLADTGRGASLGEDKGSLRAMCDEISRVKDVAVSADAPSEEIARAGCDPEVYRAYEKALRKSGNVDFGDLILLPIRLLRNNPDVRDRTRQRFSVVLVDEYQDSNIAQFELLKELWRPETYLCVVGDDDQSIYRFRGAEVGNILSFPDVFPGTKIVRLERNYRSTQSILDVATAVVSNNKGRLGKTLWTEKPAGQIPTVCALEDQDDEAELCGRLAADDFEGTTAILYRMNAQSRHFEEHFLRKRIRFRLIGARRFYDREEVKDAVAYLGLLQNPNDEVGFRRVVNKPVRGLGPASVEKLVEAWRTGSGTLLDACRHERSALPPRARAGLTEFLAALDEVAAELPRTRLSEVGRLLLSRTGLHDMYRSRDRSDDTSKSGNLEEMVTAMADYGTGQDALARYLEDIALASPADDPSTGDPTARVSLITLHNTKGLEFDRVIITGMEEGIFPHESSSWGAPEEMEEERRLFYVGITRARERLVLTWCRRRRIFGRWADMSPSRFLDEIPEDGAERVGEDAGAGGAEYPVGSGVFHDEYGPGVVERAWYNEGTLLVQVRFQSGRVARFLPKYTRLERISLGE
ncbi:MAG TPA: UvrD-helicase domain-containing protein [Spirochaetia bacterium]|nr:UvrD-helicase domain-containing protein [Spirochaetia bacterium]